MVNYDTIPEEAQVQPAAKTAGNEFALRTATPTVSTPRSWVLVKHEVVPVASALDYTVQTTAKTQGVEFPMWLPARTEENADAEQTCRWGLVQDGARMGRRRYAPGALRRASRLVALHAEHLRATSAASTSKKLRVSSRSCLTRPRSTEASTAVSCARPPTGLPSRASWTTRTKTSEGREDQDADADEPEDQSEDQSEGD